MVIWPCLRQGRHYSIRQRGSHGSRTVHIARGFHGRDDTRVEVGHARLREHWHRALVARERELHRRCR
jgi:hypothetical protein